LEINLLQNGKLINSTTVTGSNQLDESELGLLTDSSLYSGGVSLTSGDGILDYKRMVTVWWAVVKRKKS